MTIQEQIDDARAAATAWYPLDIPGASDLVVALNGYADTMEKLLAVYEAALIWERDEDRTDETEHNLIMAVQNAVKDS